MLLVREDRRPLALQVRDRIWGMLQDGLFHPSQKMPAEQELAVRFGVSRATVREALKILEEERVIICRHGVGRFVAPDPSSVLSEEITHLKSVTEMATGLGFALETDVLSVQEELADEAARVALSLERGNTVVVLERVRRVQGEAIIYSVDTFPTRLVIGEIDPVEFTGSLLTIMEERWNARLSYCKAVFSAVTLVPDVSQRIGAPDGVPWIFMESINYDSQHRPVLYSKDYHRGDKIQFRVLRRRR